MNINEYQGVSIKMKKSEQRRGQRGFRGTDLPLVLGREEVVKGSLDAPSIPFKALLDERRVQLIENHLNSNK